MKYLIVILFLLFGARVVGQINYTNPTFIYRVRMTGSFTVKDTTLNISRLTKIAGMSVRGSSLHFYNVSGIDSFIFDKPTNITGGGGDMILASTQTVTGAKTFNDLILKLRNPANTFSYSIKNGAILADHILGLPVIAADDTLAVRGINNKFIVGQTVSNGGGTQNGYTVKSTTNTSFAAIDLYNDNINLTQVFNLGSTYATNGVFIAGRGGLLAEASAGLAISAYNAAGVIAFSSDGIAERMRLDASGRLGIGQSSPTAFLHLPAGTATANTASLKIPVAAALLSTPEDGAIERDATDLYLDSATIRYVIPHGLKGSATLNFLNIIANSASELTFSLTGAREGDIVILQTPYTTSGIEVRFEAYVTSSNVVTVVATNLDALYDVYPPSGLFKVFLLKY